MPSKIFYTDISNYTKQLHIEFIAREIRSKKMTDSNKEIVEILKGIEKQLGDIKYDLTDIKRELPTVPFYGDLLQDIVNAINNIPQ